MNDRGVDDDQFWLASDSRNSPSRFIITHTAFLPAT